MDLLDRWAAGDGEALPELVRLHAPWLRGHVRRKMSAKMRQFDTSEDVVQSVLMNLLRSGPSFRPANAEQFRGLIARCVFNRMSELHDFVSRKSRDPDRVQQIPSQPDHFDVRIPSSVDPVRKVTDKEDRSFLAVALNLIEPEDRRVIQWHDFDGTGFAEIGQRLSMTEDGARSRHRRALARLRGQAMRLQRGQLEDLVQDLRDETGSRG
jgi:RNA polymerase sigma factor (sigma-70 family)